MKTLHDDIVVSWKTYEADMNEGHKGRIFVNRDWLFVFFVNCIYEYQDIICIVKRDQTIHLS